MTTAGRASRLLKKELCYFLSFPRPGKILFDHIPKCGGSSMTAYLEEQYPNRKIFSTDGCAPQASVDLFKSYPKKRRHGYDLIKGHLAHELVKYVHPESLKITVLREPIDRIISHYYFVKRETQHYLHKKVTGTGLSLEEYVVSELSDELRNWYTTHFSGLTAAAAEQAPQEAVTKAVETVQKTYDIVGFLDDPASFSEKLMVAAHFKRKYDNRRENVTHDRPAYADIPESTIKKIEEINHLDIAFYRKIKATV